jgi:hypothetical protein
MPQIQRRHRRMTIQTSSVKPQQDMPQIKVLNLKSRLPY